MANDGGECEETVESIRPAGPEHPLQRCLRYIFTTTGGCCLICLFCAAIVIWAKRYFIISDGMSYLDIASEVNRGDFAALGNPYWSPAYPGLIAVFILLFRPSPAWEVPLIQLTNFFIFLLALSTFTLFFRSWTESIPEFEKASDKDKSLLRLFAFASFFCFTFSLIPLQLTTPDVLVEAVVLLLAAWGLRVTRHDAGIKQFIILGALLGAGIYVKAALFPLAFAFIALLFIVLMRRSKLHRSKHLVHLGATALMCGVVATPLIVCMSVEQGRFTTGETGRLNYVWNVDGVTPYHVGWTGDTPAEYGTPLHGPRKLMESPTVLEFATPVAGTYPLWHSPAYWYAGIKPVISLRKQILAIRTSVHQFVKIAVGLGGFVGGAVLLLVMGMRKSKSTRPLRFSPLLVLWPLTALLMYGAVTVEGRYVGAFLLLLCLELYGVLVFRVERRAAIAVCAIALAVTMVPVVISISGSLRASVKQLRNPKDEGYIDVGKNLVSLGLQPGDQVAVIGYAKNCYYARYGRLRIVAQIPNSDEFWSLSEVEAKRVEDRLQSIGVKAVIAVDRPVGNPWSGWTQVGRSEGTAISVHPLGQANVAAN